MYIYVSLYYPYMHIRANCKKSQIPKYAKEKVRKEKFLLIGPVISQLISLTENINM